LPSLFFNDRLSYGKSAAANVVFVSGDFGSRLDVSICIFWPQWNVRFAWIVGHGGFHYAEVGLILLCLHKRLTHYLRAEPGVAEQDQKHNSRRKNYGE